MKKLFLLSAVVFGLVFYSCSSDDDNNPIEEKVELVGDWQLTNVDFTLINEEGRLIPASDPCIMELVAGYRFFEDNSFFFILEEGAPLPTEGDFWTWEGDLDDFKIIQKNLSRPPYNFSITPTDLKVAEVNGKTTMTFHSKLGNGSEANFTLVKTNEINQDLLPSFTAPEGEYEYCNFEL